MFRGRVYYSDPLWKRGTGRHLPLVESWSSSIARVKSASDVQTPDSKRRSRSTDHVARSHMGESQKHVQTPQFLPEVGDLPADQLHIVVSPSLTFNLRQEHFLMHFHRSQIRQVKHTRSELKNLATGPRCQRTRDRELVLSRSAVAAALSL